MIIINNVFFLFYFSYFIDKYFLKSAVKYYLNKWIENKYQ